VSARRDMNVEGTQKAINVHIKSFLGHFFAHLIPDSCFLRAMKLLIRFP
jgi:hypothetical protein